jgi:c-di-GMP-binding flagellar brake protein YcgR/ribosomal protein L12E/L44/L45/RPP1/RPP2
MILQTLLVSKDDPTAEMLIQVLAQFGVAVDRSNAIDVAIARLSEERFDQVIVDFEDPEAALSVIEACRRPAGPDHNQPVTVALLQDKTQIRSILGAGAHFIVAKPVEREQAKNTLRAATALLKRERRQSARIPVQAAISLQLTEGTPVEGILLDLSTGGMDVLAAKPLPPATLAQVLFELPGDGARIQAQAEVAWSTANGQIGLRFLEMEATTRDQMSEWLAARSQEALPEESEPVSQCRLTDLSLGGCYVETQSPFPQGSAIDLCLRASGMEIHAEGVVRVMHPEHGMGIEFPSKTDQQRKSVADFIEFLTSQPGTMPQLEISPRALIASSAESVETPVDSEPQEAEDSLLELIRTGTGLEEEAFLDQLQRQRTPADVAQ